MWLEKKMKIVVDTNMVSPHTAPLSLELAKLCGRENVAYAVHELAQDPFRTSAVHDLVHDILYDPTTTPASFEKLIEEADLVMESRRDFDLMESRVVRNKPTYYISERWFKPIDILHLSDAEHARGCGLWFSGFWRMLLPFGWRRARKIYHLLTQEGDFLYLPVGIRAARDMARLCGLLHGDYKCLFHAPELDFERRPLGRIWLKNGQDEKLYCLDKMRMWGYYVSSSKTDLSTVCAANNGNQNVVKVLWVGRLLSWKRVDTIVRAVGELSNLKCNDDSIPTITLDIYGDGPEKGRLQDMARKYGQAIRFYPSIQYAEVRRVMRAHDVYVLSSNSFEGWGAVVSEALEEGMKVIGTYEAGSSATILPEENLFHAGDWKALKTMLENGVADVGIGKWTASYAAQALISHISGRENLNA